MLANVIKFVLSITVALFKWYFKSQYYLLMLVFSFASFVLPNDLDKTLQLKFNLVLMCKVEVVY